LTLSSPHQPAPRGEWDLHDAWPNATCRRDGNIHGEKRGGEKGVTLASGKFDGHEPLLGHEPLNGHETSTETGKGTLDPCFWPNGRWWLIGMLLGRFGADWLGYGGKL